MTLTRLFAALIVATMFCLSARGQEAFTDHRPRFLVDGEFGTENSLGTEFPSTAIGPSIEVPIKNRFEFQSAVSYSPDRKTVTHDGESLKFGGSAIGFATHRLGFIATVAHTSLWTSQFDKRSWLPAAGIVLRTQYWGPGRLYLTYLFPTGCVWATSSDPCTIQSNRLQGIQLRQEVRYGSHIRWGYGGALYHECDQSNQNEPQAGRNCHWDATVMITASLEFRLGHMTQFRLLHRPWDNF